MAAVGFAFIFVLFAFVLPLALYWFVKGEDPDPSETTSWTDARDGASRDTFGGGRRDRASKDTYRGGRRDPDDDGDDRESRDDDAPRGNHWG